MSMRYSLPSRMPLLAVLLLAAPAALAQDAASPAAQMQDHSKMDHSKMDHSKMDHSKMDHSKMDHSKMDHSKMDHSKMDQSKMDHSKMDHSKMDHSKMDHSRMDHSKMDHSKMDHSKMDHSKMDHSKMDHSKMDHSKMDHSKMDHSKMDHSKMDHSKMDHSKMDHSQHDAAPAEPREPVPALTDADRSAAFPPGLHAHGMHDDAIYSKWMLDRLEYSDNDPGHAMSWQAKASIGGDINKLWLRSEGERADSVTQTADLEILYGRGISAWWDVLAGVRHDFQPGRSQTFAALGMQGLAPMKFEVSAMAYIGEHGHSFVSLEAEYELLLTNRLILQPLLEVEAHAGNDATRGIGSGLSSAEAGLRLRYEFSKRFAPYIGVVHERSFGNTADLQGLHGERDRDTRFVVGLRGWF